MVRAANVDTGRTITEEMESKYAENEQMDEHVIGVKTIEMVAMEKIHRKQKLAFQLSFLFSYSFICTLLKNAANE